MLGVLLLFGLVGCAVESAPPAPTSPQAFATAVPTASPTGAGLALDPDGGAAANLDFFSSVVDRVWKSDDRNKGRAYVDALVDAGFERADMQVTRDTSTVGNAAESIQFSVLWKGECLVGQVGPSTRRPAAVVLPELPEGGCLVGNTRPIDW